MPLYEFICTKCNHKFQDVIRYEDPNPPCPACKQPAPERQFPLTGKPKFVGSGFYETDYKKKS